MDAPHTVRRRLSITALAAQAGSRRRSIQIGPRIRVGGTLGAIGQGVKEGVGKVASVAAPIAGMFNPLLGAGLAGAGRALDTSQGGAGIGDLLGSAATTYGVGKLAQVTGLSDRARALLGALGIGGGAGGGSGTIADASTGGMPSDGSGGGLLGTLKAAAGGLLNSGGGGGSTSGAGGTSGGQGTSLLDKLLMGGTIAAGAADAVQKHNLQNKAQDYATSSYDAKAPLRARAQALLANDPKPDPQLAAISTDAGNVYDRARRARMLAASATSPSAPTA